MFSILVSVNVKLRKMSNLSILPRTLTAFLCILFLSVMFQSCSLFRMAQLKNCDFQVERIESINLDGVNIRKIHSISDLGMANAARILSDLSKGSLNSDFAIILSVKNPNKSAAVIEKFDYLILLDDKEAVSGSSNTKIDIPADKQVEFPLSARANLSQLLSQNSITALLDLANSLSKENTISKRVKIKVKPYISIGKKYLKYPGYVLIKFREV